MLGVAGRFFDLTDRIHLAKTVELNEAALSIDAEARKLCAGLTEDQLNWHLKPGNWSIAENLAHLRITTVDELLRAGAGSLSRLPGGAEAADRGRRWFRPHRAAIFISRYTLFSCQPAGVLFGIQCALPAASLAG